MSPWGLHIQFAIPLVVVVVRRYILYVASVSLFLSSAKKIYTTAGKNCAIQARGSKQHMEIEYWDKEQGERERDWCELAFVDFPKVEAEREKNMCTHTVILTPLSLPDLRVMEVWSVILMNKNHTDTLLVKMREEKCILLLFTFQKKECVGNREKQRYRDRKTTD